jgi:succinate dehydrogenase / fumarate reductase cytochrome b subunit
MTSSNAPSPSLRLLARKYRWKYAGMLGYLIQRVTGIGLLVYLFLHVHTIHELRDPASFDRAMAQFRQPVFKLGEIALLGAVILHALNGIRLTLVDLGIGLNKQRQMFWYFAIGVGCIVFLAGAVPIFLNIKWQVSGQ